MKELTAQIVAAYVKNNTVTVAELPKIISDVYISLTTVGTPSTVSVQTAAPVVSVRKSITPDHLLCLECGKQLKMLKRHLSTDHNLSVKEYIAKYQLPSDYPSVASNYSLARSNMAKDIGLGKTKERTPAAKPKRARSKASEKAS